MRKTINPNKSGSLGINNPKLSENSSILMESGVKKAMDKNILSVLKTAKYINIKATGKSVNQNKSFKIKNENPINMSPIGRI